MSSDTAKQFVEFARQEIRSGNFQGARENAEKAVNLAPSSSEAHHMLGVALANLGLNEAAIQSLKRATTLAPTDARALFNLSVQLHAMQNDQEALAAARAVLEIEPNNGRAAELVRVLTMPAVPPPLPEDIPRSYAPPVMSSQPQTHAGYYNQYANQSASIFRGPVHSIRFVEELGKKWDYIGAALTVCNIVLQTFQIYRTVHDFLPMLGKILSEGPQVAEKMNNPTSLPLLFLGYAIQLGLFIWFVIELADRRSKWLWLVPVLCCPSVLVVPLYMIYGREADA